MNNLWSRILFQLFTFTMWGMAIVGSLLFLSALLGLVGYLPDWMSLKMMGQTVETKTDYHAFMKLTAAFTLIGLIYAFLRASGRLRYVDVQAAGEIEIHNQSEQDNPITRP